MFSLFHKIETKTSVDIHSHLIPNIDDGVKDIEISIELICELKKMGYKKLITTPHISDMFPNSTEEILAGYKNLKEELSKREIEIEIEVAAEYYADKNFENLLEKNDILSFGKERYLLFELSYFTPPSNLDDLIYEMRLKGYTPILAHPERYIYLHDDFNRYKNLKEMDLLFQINLVSTVGYYNSDIKTVVHKLIRGGMVDFVGTDIHHISYIKALKKCFSQAIYKKLFKTNTILNNRLII